MPTVVTSGDPRVQIDTLRSVLGSQHTVRSADLSSTRRLVEATQGAEALVVDTGVPVPAEVFDACGDLQVVARAGTGVDNIDVVAAADDGVTVTNVPEYCTEEVSTHAVSLFVTLFRRIKSYDRAIESGRWDWTDGRPIRRLSEQTVGFYSFGGIARRTAEKMAGFGCELVAADPYVDAEEMAEYGVEKLSFGELLETADHVSIHAPLTEETRHSFDRDAFERMGETADPHQCRARADRRPDGAPRGARRRGDRRRGTRRVERGAAGGLRTRRPRRRGRNAPRGVLFGGLAGRSQRARRTGRS